MIAPTRTVWKVRLEAVVQTVDLPATATTLTVATQHGAPCIWLEVDTSQPSERRTFVLVGTGQIVGAAAVYLGTAHDAFGSGLVMHVYERFNDAP